MPDATPTAAERAAQAERKKELDRLWAIIEKRPPGRYMDKANETYRRLKAEADHFERRYGPA